MLNNFTRRLMVLVMAVSCGVSDAVRAAIPPREGQAVNAPAPATAAIDPHDGRVVDGFFAGTKKLIVYIQDVHCNGGVQRAISGILASIDSLSPNSAVFVEGAPRGAVDVSVLANYPDSPAKRHALGRLMDTGLITGAEYYALCDGTKKLYGIEDPMVYAANLQRLRALIKNRDGNGAVARAIVKRTKASARRHLSPELYRLQRRVSIDSARKRPARYFARLERYAATAGIDLRQYPACNRYSRMAAISRAMKNTRLYDVRAAYIREFQEHAAAFNPQNFFFEQQALAEEVLARGALRQSEKDVLFLSRASRIVADMVDLKVTARDFAWLKDHEVHYYALLAAYCGVDVQRAALVVLRGQELMDYYALNTRRDEIFMRSILGSAPAQPPVHAAPGRSSAQEVLSRIHEFKRIDVVVAGGYHDGLADRLRDASISFLTIMPAVTAPGPADEDLYRGLIADTLDIEKVVGAAYKDPVGDIALFARGSFTAKFFADLLILIQSGKRFNMTDDDIIHAIDDWRRRETGPDTQHPLHALRVVRGAEPGEWLLFLSGVPMLRTVIKEDGSAITDVDYYGDGRHVRARSAGVRDAWDKLSAAWAPTGLGELVPSFVIRDNGDLDGFVGRQRARAGEAFETPEQFARTLTMERITKQIKAGHKVVFVMGHANPDPDALFSAFIKAYLLNQYAGREDTLYVPLLCVIDRGYKKIDEKDAGIVTTELKRSCRELNIDLSEMMQSRHVAHWLKTSGIPTEQLRNQIAFSMVDRQGIPPGSGFEGYQVIETADHHPNYPAEETTNLDEPFQIHQVGATLSIITRWARHAGIAVPDDAAPAIERKLALAGVSTILDDTKGLASDITRWVDVFSAYTLARRAAVDPQELYRKQETLYEPPEPGDILSDRKDSYHASILFGQHIVRKVAGSPRDYFEVEEDAREKIFALMGRFMAEGNDEGRQYNAFIQMMTCAATEETRLWIVINDEDRSLFAIHEMLRVIFKHYEHAYLEPVPGGAPHQLRYEIRGLHGLTARKVLTKQLALRHLWPEGTITYAIDAADKIIARKSMNRLTLLFGSPEERFLRYAVLPGPGVNANQLEIIIDGSVGDVQSRRTLLNSWVLVPARNGRRLARYDISCTVPLGRNNGSVEVALVINDKAHALEYRILRMPPHINSRDPLFQSEDFRYRVATAFAAEMDRDARACMQMSDATAHPFRVAHTSAFVPPRDVILPPPAAVILPVEVYERMTPHQKGDAPQDMPADTAFRSMNAAA